MWEIEVKVCNSYETVNASPQEQEVLVKLMSCSCQVSGRKQNHLTGPDDRNNRTTTLRREIHGLPQVRYQRGDIYICMGENVLSERGDFRSRAFIVPVLPFAHIIAAGDTCMQSVNICSRAKRRCNICVQDYRLWVDLQVQVCRRWQGISLMISWE